MITNLEILDDETALAFGQKFDVPRVLEAMIAFLRTFAADIVAAAPHVRPIIRFVGDGDRTAPLDEDGYARLRRETIAYARHWDVLGYVGRADIGTFQLRLYPLGLDDIQRIGDCEPTIIPKETWRNLDPTPVICFTPDAGMPIFRPTALNLVKQLILQRAPTGTKPDFAFVPTLRFPHHTFGAGFGTLRIRLLTIPIEP